MSVVGNTSFTPANIDEVVPSIEDVDYPTFTLEKIYEVKCSSQNKTQMRGISVLMSRVFKGSGNPDY